VEGVRGKLGKRIIQALKMNDDGAGPFPPPSPPPPPSLSTHTYTGREGQTRACMTWSNLRQSERLYALQGKRPCGLTHAWFVCARMYLSVCPSFPCCAHAPTGVHYAAIDVLGCLMHPMHNYYDLVQEQLNKRSLLSSRPFLARHVLGHHRPPARLSACLPA
jgi:hypothetical protein